MDYSGVMESVDIKELHKTCVERLKGLIAQAQPGPPLEHTATATNIETGQ
jgi:hypothetical protein